MSWKDLLRLALALLSIVFATAMSVFVDAKTSARRGRPIVRSVARFN
jgi:hypothetical protein